MFQVVGDCAIEAHSLLYMYPTSGVPTSQATAHDQVLSQLEMGHRSGGRACAYAHPLLCEQ